MASFIDLDSFYRNKDDFPNPFWYEVTAYQSQGWFKQERTTRAYAKNPGSNSPEFVLSITCLLLTLPYSTALAAEPRVYLDFRSNSYKDINLIQTIDGKKSQAKFICQFLSIQHDSDGNPIWIHYKSDTMEQTMRFSRQDRVLFKITLRDGTVPSNPDTPVGEPSNPAQQTMATFELMPYLKNAAIDNHLVEAYQP